MKSNLMLRGLKVLKKLYHLISSSSNLKVVGTRHLLNEQGSTTHIFEGKILCNTYTYDAVGNTLVSEEQVANRFKDIGQ